MVALAVLAVGSEAKALGGGVGWSIHGGDTLKPHDLLLYGEIGVPDVAFGLRYGLSDKFDIGGRLALLWSYGYVGGTNLGFGGEFLMRFGLIKSSKFSLLLHLDPGIKVYRYGYNDPYYNCGRFGCGYGDSALFALTIPFGAEFGLHFNPKWTLQLGADLNTDIYFTGYGGLGTVTPLFGAGFEFKPTDRLALGVNSRLGPHIYVNSYSCGGFGCGGTGFDLLAQFFIGGRL
jgi:hypothetical protein